MPKSKSTRTALSDFDKLVQEQLKKSVVVAPSDPNGGAKLPKRQEDAAKRKGRDGTQYMAVFDREAEKSNEQLDEWLRDTQETTESPDPFVEDAREDDAPEDPDEEQWEDNRGDDVYDPYGDDDELDDEDLESLELPDDEDEYVYVRAHKRRKLKKSNEAARGDMDEEFIELSDDDDDLGEGDDDEEYEDEGDERPTKREKAEKAEKAMRRRKEMRKALGADAMKYIDGSPLVKALTDAIWDLKDSLTSEIRALHLENRRLRKMIQRENRQMAKSLVNAQLQIAGYAPAAVEQQQAPARMSQPIRKGYGMPVSTSQRAVPQQFDLTKAFDVLEEAYVNGENPELLKAITMLENDGINALPYLSTDAQEVLRKAKLL
ncbi:hypothetical protein [Alicyclobacillus sendaiensis]|uniref:hypothetical protein n=1 Tax=Alicyclobacillus sendaiensis TaxID=192387 RepID=UPI0026F442F2|nr:hypothetical protein [Alicyclobacillus sendaiensis]